MPESGPLTHDPGNTLKPPRAVEGGVTAPRAGKGGAGEGEGPARRAGRGGAAAVGRTARAAGGVLRPMLRDAPPAWVELRLRALSTDALPPGELLAELRRRDRLPMELAATFHELTA